jgi:glycosyltransferase involved in cell wall biosynthesis
MSLVPLEAMARGRSIVATDVAGTREQLGDEAGAVVPPEDGSALAAAVAQRLSDPALATREGAAGRERAVRAHDIRKTTQQLVEVYEEVLAGR